MKFVFFLGDGGVRLANWNLKKPQINYLLI